MLHDAADFHYLAAYVVQSCELLARFDQDVEWVWLKPWSWIKWDFIFMRYGSLVIQTALLYQHFRSLHIPYPSSMCRPWAILRLFTPSIFITATQAVLIARVCALYHGNRRVLVVLLSLYAICITTAFVSLGILLVKPMTYNNNCRPEAVSYAWLFFTSCLPPFILDLAMLVLTTQKVLKISRGPRTEPLLRIVLRDGIWAVFAMWVAAMAALILSVTGNISRAFIIGGSWFPVITSFITTQLILNIRRLKATSEEIHDKVFEYQSPVVHDTLGASFAFELGAVPLPNQPNPPR